MTEGTLITDEMKRVIGTESKPTVFEIDKTLLKRLAEAVEDPNPLWQNEEYGKKSKLGRIIALPALLITSMMAGDRPPEPEIPLKRSLDGGGEWEYYKPIKLGDVITATSKTVDYFERPGRMGKMLFTVTEITWKNQAGEVAGRGRTTRIRY